MAWPRALPISSDTLSAESSEVSGIQSGTSGIDVAASKAASACDDMLLSAIEHGIESGKDGLDLLEALRFQWASMRDSGDISPTGGELGVDGEGENIALERKVKEILCLCRCLLVFGGHRLGGATLWRRTRQSEGAELILRRFVRSSSTGASWTLQQEKVKNTLWPFSRNGKRTCLPGLSHSQISG